LSATRLPPGKFDFDGVRITVLLKKGQRGHADLRIELINITGDEERYPQETDPKSRSQIKVKPLSF
jgi:hypothetical protein